jgi:hypothetical protein
MRGFDIEFSLEPPRWRTCLWWICLKYVPQARDAINGGCTLFTTRRRDLAALIVAPQFYAALHEFIASEAAVLAAVNLEL